MKPTALNPLVLAAFALLISVGPCRADEIAHRSEENPQQATDSVQYLPAQPKLTNWWSWQVQTQGSPSHHGYGIGLETPGAWGILAAQLTYNWDSAYDSSVDRDFNWTTLSAALKLKLARASHPAILPYLLYGWDFFAPTTPAQETGGSKQGTQIAYGIEWRFITDVWNELSAEHGVFVEVGWADSTFRSALAPTGIRVHDGATARLGFRQLF